MQGTVRLCVSTILLGAFAAAGALSGQPVGTAPAAPPVPAEAGGFQVSLYEVTANGKQVFTPNSTPVRGEASLTLTIQMGIVDKASKRIFRVLSSSGVRSVQNEAGAEVLPERLRAGESMRFESRFNFPDSASGESKDRRTLTMPLLELPRELTKIEGVFRIEVVSAVEEVDIELLEVGKEREVAPGVSIVTKLRDIDAATGAIRQLSVEMRSPASERAQDKSDLPIIRQIEVMDATGLPMARMVMQEEAVVGKTLRRRYILDRGSINSDQRNARGNVPVLPVAKGLRLTLFTDTELVSVPFSWGPISFQRSQLAPD